MSAAQPWDAENMYTSDTKIAWPTEVLQIPWLTFNPYFWRAQTDLKHAESLGTIHEVPRIALKLAIGIDP